MTNRRTESIDWIISELTNPKTEMTDPKKLGNQPDLIDPKK